ncbi:nucleotidyltransferase family protein [Ensifer sp. IC4062]|nr:nucleotidyltransferase family protein [Ensifer sp. IC4062]
MRPRFEKTLSQVDLVLLGLLGPDQSSLAWVRSSLQSCSETPALDDALFREVCARHLEVILLDLLDEDFSGNPLVERLSGSLEGRRLSAEIFRSAAERVAIDVLAISEDAGISVAFLKGLVAGDLYRTPSQRIVRDVDVLTRPESAKILFVELQRRGYSAGRYDRGSNALVPWSHYNTDGASYEMPPLWIEVDVDLDADVRRKLPRTPSMRFRWTDAEELKARVAVEIHRELFPNVAINVDWQQLNSSLDGLPKLSGELELVYAIYKSYTDLVLLQKSSGCKLAADVFRILHRRQGLLDLDLAEQVALTVGVPGALSQFLHYASSLFRMQHFRNIPAILESHPLDISDVLIAALPSRYLPFNFHSGS